MSAHWGFEDPAAAVGSEEHKRYVFHSVFHQIRARIGIFVNLPLAMLEKNALQKELDAIGKTK